MPSSENSLETKNCAFCGNEYAFERSRHGNRKQFKVSLFCSRECYHSNLRKTNSHIKEIIKQCENCGKSFNIDDTKSHSHSWFKSSKFCTKACSVDARRFNPLKDFERYYLPEPNTGCWLWVGSSSGRYGSASIDGKNARAHIVSYEMHVGPIPKGLILRHKCDQPFCVNPDHLVPGTQKENMQDKIDRGRNIVGSKCSQAKLDEEKVADILKSKSSGRYLASKYGVSEGVISMVRSRKIWRHVNVEDAV